MKLAGEKFHSQLIGFKFHHYDCIPARQMTRTFFPVVITPQWKFGYTNFNCNLFYTCCLWMRICMLHWIFFKAKIWIREDRLRANTWYLCKNKRSMAIITCEKYFFICVKMARDIFIPPNLHLLILRFFNSTILFRGVDWWHSRTPIRCLPGKRIIVFQYYLTKCYIFLLNW